MAEIDLGPATDRLLQRAAQLEFLPSYALGALVFDEKTREAEELADGPLTPQIAYLLSRGMSETAILMALEEEAEWEARLVGADIEDVRSTPKPAVRTED